MKEFPSFVSGDSVWSPPFRLIWYCVPKVASRSLLRTFTDTHLETFKGIKFKDMEGFSPHSPSLPGGISPDDCVAFACVRNPLTRIASLWFEKFRNYDGSVGKQKMFRRYRQLNPDLPFQDFVDWLLSDEGADNYADAHWRSQAAFVLDPNGELAVDHICRMETIEQDLTAVMTQAGAPAIDIGRLNSNQDRVERLAEGQKSVQSLYLELLTPATVEKLAGRYAADFELFGYDPTQLR